MQLLLALVVVAVLAFFGWQYLHQAEPPPSLQQAAETARQAAQQAGQALQQAGQALQEQARAAGETVTGSLDVGREVGAMMGELRATMERLADPARLHEALPSLDSIEARLADMQQQVQALPSEARSAVAGAVNQSLPGLRNLSDRVGAMEGGAAVKEKIDAIIYRLEGWAKAPA
jgi:hypothetical protein